VASVPLALTGSAYKHYILRLMNCFTSVTSGMVVVKSLYVTFLIHKEQFALVSKSMH